MNMLELIVNDSKTGIQFVFTDAFTKKQQFITAFDIGESKKIAIELSSMVKKLEKKK